MVRIGDVVVKIAGRDAGRAAVVVEDLGNGYYIIDGDTRKRKTNFKHIEFIGKEVKVGKNASSEEIRKVLGDMGLKVHKHGLPKPKKETTDVREQNKKSEKKTKK